VIDNHLLNQEADMRMWYGVPLAMFLGVASFVFASNSRACPAGQYSSLGMCLPEIGGAVGQGAEHLKKEIQAQVGGVPLEQWIIASHNTAISGAMPIPSNIRQALTGYASEDSMNSSSLQNWR
jgi:hypothetical protein